MKITITVNDDQQIETTLEGVVTLDTLTAALCTVQLGAMKQTVSNSGENGSQVEEALYHMYNLAASNLLSTFAPEIEMRPDITAQAIMELENKIIEEHYGNLPEETDEEGI